MNGVYLNSKRIAIQVTTPLSDGDELCFGCKVSENELKYKFVLKDSRALLERSAESLGAHQQSKKPDEADSKSCLDIKCTPPLVRTKRIMPKKKPPARKRLKLESSTSSTSSAHSSALLATTVTPPLSPSTSPTQPSYQSAKSLIISPQSSAVQQVVSASEATLSSQSISTAGPELQDNNASKLDSRLLVPTTAKTTPSMPLAASCVSPSPALSTFSTKSTDKEVEDLFDDVSNSDDRLLDEAIFGGNSQTQQVSSAIPMDGATIQVLAVQDQMQQERQKLLSSIEALKSELAAKNELITEQEKKNTDTGVVSSMREEFTCVICQELFICAHTLSCSHSFCERCIKEWMKTHKDCPICRKCSTTQPIRSLALDNAIATVESKLSAEEKKERDTVKEERMVLMGVKAPSTKPSVIVIASPSISTTGLSHSSASRSSNNETIIVSDDESESNSSNGDSESDSSDDESSENNYGTYGSYGGYGRCYHCGKWL